MLLDQRLSWTVEVRGWTVEKGEQHTMSENIEPNLNRVPLLEKHDPELWEIQGIDIIANNYYTDKTTGAQAVLAVWTEIENETLDAVAEKLGFPEPLGVVHAISTFAKNLAISGVLRKTRDNSTPWR
jgi:hypothetical protein